MDSNRPISQSIVSDPDSALEYVGQIRDIQSAAQIGTFGVRAISIFSKYIKKQVEDSSDEEETTVS